MVGTHYRVEREIGRGGMAYVYLCTDLRDGTRVAVKVLRPELGSAVVVERFLREIRFASELDHPQIPKVFDSGVSDGLPYYVMTYLEGESLRSRIDRAKQLPIEEAVRITCEVITPMAYAHSKGIVHRDIKPANIFVTNDRVYVLDFGVARAIVVSADETLTSTGVTVGTPAYMSPEQALADRDLDARSDIYSLACVAYEMIAGIPPFVGATPQSVMARRFLAAAPPLRETRDLVPETIEVAIAKALCKTPADRWQTVQEFGKALSGISSASVPTVSRVGGTQQRRRSMARAIGGLLGLAALGGGVWGWKSLRTTNADQIDDKIRSWDFAAAEAQLRPAARSGDANANLQIAELMMLRGASIDDWKPAVLAASDAKASLDSAGRMRVQALLSYESGDIAGACSRLAKIAQTPLAHSASGVVAPLALADCLFSDNTVVADAHSPSGFRFSADYAAIDSIYEDLLAHNDSNPRAYALLIPRIRNVVETDKRLFRKGKAKGTEGAMFYAQPALIADTIAYIPYPPPTGGGPAHLGDFELIEAAFERNQSRLADLAKKWVQVDPKSPDAHELYANLLEAQGELGSGTESAKAELAVAVAMAAKTDDGSWHAFARRLRLSTSQVQILIRLGEFAEAGKVAEKAISLSPPKGHELPDYDTAVDFLWRLQAIRGRVSSVVGIEKQYPASFHVAVPGGVMDLPPELAADIIALSDYSAFGAPRDSILATIRRIDSRIPALISPRKIKAFRNGVLERPMWLAAPVIGVNAISTLEATSDPVGRVVHAMARGDNVAAKKYLDSLTAMHAEKAPGEVSMDITYIEAWLTQQLGDEAGAARILDNSLNGLSKSPPSMLKNPTLIASLVRAMILRADIAHSRHEQSVEKRWRDASIDLWGKGDPALVATLGSSVN